MTKTNDQADVDELRNALLQCLPILDSFLNGQGAIEVDEIDDALTNARRVLRLPS